MRRLTLFTALLLVASLASAQAAFSSVSASCTVVNAPESYGWNMDAALGARTFDSLQGAIDAAHPGDTLIVRGTCHGISTIGKSLTLVGNSDGHLAEPTLDGDRLGSVLTIDGRVTVAVKGLTIVDGKALAFGRGGGGIANRRGTLTVTGSTISGNAATEGGGIANYYDGSVTVTHSTVSGNSASAGGGLYNDSAGTVTVGDSSVRDNNAWLGGGFSAGGGIMNHGKLAIDHSIVSGNTGSVGGGICNLHYATLTITHSTLSRNSGDGGGAIAAWYQGGSVKLVDSIVADNKATYRGGGIDMDYGGSLALVNTTVRGNTSASGGGIANYWGGTVTLDRSTLLGNTGRGGGLITFGGGTVAVIDSAVIGNSSPEVGAGLINDGTLTVTRSTVADNKALYFGGGILNFNKLEVIDSIVRANGADYAGGIDSQQTGPVPVVEISNSIVELTGGQDAIRNGGTMTITHSKIRSNTGSGIVNLGTLTLTDTVVSDNTGAYAGGGLYNARGTVTMTGSQVTRNRSTLGGGIITYGELVLDRSTVSLNTATAGGGVFSSGGTVVALNSILSRNSAKEMGGGIYNALGAVTLKGFSLITRNTAGIEGGGIYSFGGPLTNCIAGRNVIFNQPDNIR